MKKPLLKGKKLLDFSKQLFNAYKKDIIYLIEKTTKKKFRYKQFKFELEKGLDYWTLKKNKIIIGSESIKPADRVLGPIIHEMMHINTYNTLQKEYAAGRAKKIEKWTVNKTNSILRNINNKHKTKFKFQNYD